MDPLAEKYPAWSTFNYVLGNPVRLVDPDGKAPKDHIFYLVIQKGAEVNPSQLAANTQRMLNDNGINLQVQVIHVGDQGFTDPNFKSKLDQTDALTFIGNESFVEGIYARGNINFGYTDERVGYVNLGDQHSSLKTSEYKTEHLARAAIHEGVGHEFAGRGHPDESTPGWNRYKKWYHPEKFQNIMTSGANTTWSINPFENGGSLFLPEDLKIINSKILQKSPLINPITGRYFSSSKDNFTKRLKHY